jgi:DNA-binding beta-propeller fold protein YncE
MGGGYSARIARFLAATAGLAVSLALVPAASAARFEFLRAWGTEGNAPGQFRTPDGIAVDLRGNVYVADRENNRIQKFDSNGSLIAIWGRGDGSLGLGPGEFNGPYAVATDGYGNVYVLDSRNNRVQKFSSSGRFLLMWGRGGGDGSFGVGPGELADPRGIEVERRGIVYVSDHGNNRIQAFTLDGRLLSVWGRNGGDGSAGTGPGEFDGPRSAATDRAGNVYVVEKFNHRIQKLTPQGAFVTRWGRNGGAGGGDVAIGSADGEFNLPYDAAVDSRDNVYVVDTSNTRVQRFDTSGRFLSRWGMPGIGPGQFHDPYQVAIDCRDNVYVTDERNSRVQKFGDPRAPAPRCAPRLRLSRPAWSASREAVVVRAVCDQPCGIGAAGSIRLPGGDRAGLRPARVRVGAEERATLVLRTASGAAGRVRAALRGGAGPVARVRARAAGFGGRGAARERTIGLRR